MKFNFYSPTLYYNAIMRLLNTTKYSLIMVNLPLAIVLWLYILTAIVYILLILEYVNIISIDFYTMDYLEFNAELPDIEVNTMKNNFYCFLEIVLKITNYINNSKIIIG